ncbi:MAG: hypothetical protein WC562_07255 [Dehalococcoidia bacterium]
MGEMKSAYDRAMERAGKLGKLSPDEMKKQEDERLLTIGKAIADKYLTHGSTQILKDDIEKLRAEDRSLVGKGARLGLAGSLSFDKGVTMESVDRVAEGLTALAADKKGAIDESIDGVKKLLEEMEAALDTTYSKEYSHLESERRVLLQGVGISGSAVAGVNVEGSAAWRKIEEALREQYNAKLEPLKQKLAEAVA